MLRGLKFSIRFKILITLLFVVTVIVSIITFTMANMFHADKTVYVHDMTSIIAVHISEETGSFIGGYRERLQVFARFIFERDFHQKQKAKLLKQLFEDFQEFVAVTIYEEGIKPVTIYDAKSLESAGLTKDSLSGFRAEHPLPKDRIYSGKVFVENSTLSEKLPVMTMSIPYQHPDSDEPVIVSAVIRLDKLLRLARESKVFEAFVIDSRGILLAHYDKQQVVLRSRADWIPGSLQKQQSLGSTVEYVYNGKKMIGGFSQIDFGGLLAGVQIPKTAAYLTARELLNNLMLVSLVLLILSALLSLFGSRRITKPVERLLKATKEVGKGQFSIKIERSSRDEIGDLADSFNQMASELDSREKALKDAQTALIHSEKMAAFGQLGAGIAHEVKNPLAGILGFTQLLLKKLDQDNPLHENLTIIEKETKRCKTIIENLMKFTRQEKAVFEPTEINRVVEDAVGIVEHQLGINQVKVEKDLPPALPPVMGNGNQIQQVLMNLMINAQQAMDGNPGTVKVLTRALDSGLVEIRVSDTGPGIPKDIHTKIFEPFFTTKTTGKGTGLGLSVSYGIIKDHKGDLRVESEPGKGTTFVITLPVAPQDEKNVFL